MLGNKLLNIQFAKYHIWNNKRETFNQIPPMFSREINWSEGFPNMVLSTEYSEAVKASYRFQPLWVSGKTHNGPLMLFTCLLVSFTDNIYRCFIRKTKIISCEERMAQYCAPAWSIGKDPLEGPRRFTESNS